MATMNSHYKILFVTYSVTLIHNWVIKLIPHLEDCDVLVCHIGSLEDRSPTKVLPVKNIDLSRLTYQQIVDVVNEYKPTACVFFNFKGIIEQLILRICKEKHIKTIYLEHGIITKDVMTFKKIRRKNLFKRIRRTYVQLAQYLAYIAHASNPRTELRIMYDVLRNNNFSLSPFDCYFVFGHRCLEFLKNIFPLEEKKNAFIAGYPLFETNEQVREAQSPETKKGVLYVHQPFILDHYSPISYEEEKKYITKWYNKLAQFEENFTILLHPRENIELYNKLYSKTGINIIQSPNNYHVFKQASIVLGHYSTALLYPLYFNIPTYLIDYPDITSQSIFENVFPHLNLEDEIPLNQDVEYPNKSYLIGFYNTYEHIAKEIHKCL